MIRIILLLAGLLVATPAAASQIFANGELTDDAFYWKGGGEDPLKISLQEAAAIKRLGIPKVVQDRFAAAMKAKPEGQDKDYYIQDGERMGDVMVSGQGTLAMNPVAITSAWKNGRSRRARVWYVRDENGQQWRFIVPDVCNNLIVKRMSTPVPCKCDAEKGDACVTLTS